MNSLFRAVSLAAVAFLAIPGCSFSFKHADAEGKAVQQKIDEASTPMIRDYYPSRKCGVAAGGSRITTMYCRSENDLLEEIRC